MTVDHESINSDEAVISLKNKELGRFQIMREMHANHPFTNGLMVNALVV